jgi:sensor histidine kinase YesM
MSTLKRIHIFLSISAVKHVLFWIGVFSYFIITTDLKFYNNYEQLIVDKTIIVAMQIITAYTCIYVLIPKFLVPKRNILFIISILLLVASVYTLFVYIQEYHFRPWVFNNKNASVAYISIEQFYKYIFEFPVFTGKSVKFLTPTVIIVLARYYKDQQKFLQLSEQKRTTELATLKHQLNPHFLFNTLNNLYSLTVTKSDEAPEVIEKLSEMLDHMLYGCNDQYVSLYKEIELIENYLALEKVRYDDRVTITFTKTVNKNVLIAPLILLTFVENAFKHGVTQELEEANIQIEISLKENDIHFDISNSIATNRVLSNKKGIGLENVKKQLELLYPNAYSLAIKEEKKRFNVSLKLLSE